MTKIKEEWKQSNGKYKCPDCGKEYKKKGMGYHIWKQHGDGKDFIPFKNHNVKGKKSWNKGLTKNDHPSLQKISNTIKTKRESGEIKDTPHTEEFKKYLSFLAKKRGLGGVTQSRWINYKGKTLGSSYELEVAKSLDENNIKWDTCKRFTYIDPFGKKRNYTPDIFLIDYDMYLDPKNDFLINNINPRLGFKDTEKISLVEKQNNISVIILNKDELDWKFIKEKIATVAQSGLPVL